MLIEKLHDQFFPPMIMFICAKCRFWLNSNYHWWFYWLPVNCENLIFIIFILFIFFFLHEIEIQEAMLPSANVTFRKSVVLLLVAVNKKCVHYSVCHRVYTHEKKNPDSGAFQEFGENFFWDKSIWTDLNLWQRFFQNQR